jgi:hypothetical protein
LSFFIHDRRGGTHLEHPQVIIAPPDHPLAKPRSISPREIAKQTILMREVGSGTRLLAERFLAQHGIEPRIGMEKGSNETIKQAVMAGLGIAFISAHTIAAEIDDGRLAILDVAGLPEIRQWFVVHPATKRMMPAASSLRDFLVAEGRRFLPNLKHGRRGAKTPAARGITLPRGSDDNFRFSGEGLAGHPCSQRVLCGLLPTLEKKGQRGHPLTGTFCTLLLRRNHAHHCFRSRRHVDRYRS